MYILVARVDRIEQSAVSGVTPPPYEQGLSSGSMRLYCRAPIAPCRA